ncbi:MAG: restriction endonuclease subunit S, partial [Dolichospermum sp.]
MSKWTNRKVGDIIQFNPPEKLKKGKIAKKISMDCLQTYQRKITGYQYEEYSSNPKFRNGDTLLAKITPCLENGKTAQVDILDNNEIAFGSSEFIVL